jgi:hypothetical protein
MHIFECRTRYLPPWGIEFNEQILVLGKLLVKVGVSEHEDTLISLDSGDGADHEGGGEQEK